MRAIENMVVRHGRCMTRLDAALQDAIAVSMLHGLPYSAISPVREDGRITGYEVDFTRKNTPGATG